MAWVGHHHVGTGYVSGGIPCPDEQVGRGGGCVYHDIHSLVGMRAGDWAEKNLTAYLIECWTSSSDIWDVAELREWKEFEAEVNGIRGNDITAPG